MRSLFINRYGQLQIVNVKGILVTMNLLQLCRYDLTSSNTNIYVQFIMNLMRFLASLIVFPTVFFVIYQVISLIQTGNSLSADTLLNSGRNSWKA